MVLLVELVKLVILVRLVLLVEFVGRVKKKIGWVGLITHSFQFGSIDIGLFICYKKIEN